MDLEHSIYPGSFYSLLGFLDRKEVPYENVADLFPPPDCDLDALAASVIQADPVPDHEFDRQDAARKYQTLLVEFDGCSELWAVHAMAIAVLRRRNPPEFVRQLFLRIWREKGKELADGLPVRWLISSATTFADHGDTFEQRSGGMGLSVLFDLIKLHDSERRVSGRPNDAAFPRLKSKPRNHPLAFDMAGYSLPNGDLDRIMLARLWRLAEQDATLRPLGFRMLRMVMTDKRSVFSRVQRYRRTKSDG
ncbi:hypothetical protein QEZ52_14400 [Aliisedimentitalea scapharcae]|uniref:Uncharacterized protein n=1 Tax=Aliisedimentitalea scapharcae TaxID=1524259 RepID=A0ABZ2XNX5_9RHOB|nr:hypothetical protein K3727_14300 [Rhodobacteraceae bacterium M382]